MENYKAISKEIKSKDLCPGISWKTSNDNGDGDFDAEIVPLLKLLNTTEWHTTSSCAGHSSAYLRDPMKGYGIDSPYRICIYIHVHERTIDKFMKLVQSFDDVSDGRLWCNLGYRPDYSNLVEKHYIPFEIIVLCGTKSIRDRILKSYEKIAQG